MVVAPVVVVVVVVVMSKSAVANRVGCYCDLCAPPNAGSPVCRCCCLWPALVGEVVWLEAPLWLLEVRPYMLPRVEVGEGGGCRRDGMAGEEEEEDTPVVRTKVHTFTDIDNILTSKESVGRYKSRCLKIYGNEGGIKTEKDGPVV